MDIEATVPVGLDRATVQVLSRRSDWHGLGQLGTHFALLGVTGYLIWASRGGPWLAAAIVLHGVVLDFLFCALHESIHRTAFATRWLNDAVAFLCGVLLMLPCDYFRLFHFAHHRFTQDPLKDPELSAKKPSSIGAYLWLASGLPNWWKRLTVTLRHALTGQVPEPFVPPSKRPAIVREARLVWAIYAAVALISLTLWRADALVYWVLPAMAGQPFLRLFLLAEHTGCAFGNDMFANTRTTYTNAAVRLLTWRMSYHVEHHAFPSVPFHALAKVNVLIQDRIIEIGHGYLAVQRGLIQDMTSRAPKRPSESPPAGAIEGESRGL
jgi:fatty acid desaturase